MELDEFVKTSLVSLARGIEQANIDLNGGDKRPGDNGWRTHFILWRGTKESSRIDFDIAVTASKKGAGGVNAKIRVWEAEVGAGGRGEISRENVSRVKFPVFVEFGIT